jgi:two-component system chemotaxis response regulator CheY
VKNLARHRERRDDGVDGLRKLASTKYDVIITDINMPIMRAEAGQAGPHPSGNSDTPIIIIARPKASQEDRQRALQSEPTRTSPSPSRPPQVITAKVKELLKIE